MLVLTRKLNDVILIDGGIKVMVCKITPDRVRIGIEAPPGVKVLRAELAEPEAGDPSNDTA